MPDQRLGELFALLTAVCWVIGAIFFEISGRRIGSLVVNVLRLSLAVVLLSLICFVTSGRFWPTDMPRHVFLWIALSGFIGFFLCDMCLFRAFVLAGARRAMLMLSLAPAFAAVLDTAIGQPPTVTMLVGMIVTLSGAIWVITSRPAVAESPHTRRQVRIGILLGLAAAVLQALGATTANIGLSDQAAGSDPMAATLVRALAGAVSFALLILVTGRVKTVIAGMRDTTAVILLSIGCVFGPVIGVVLFMASLSRILPSVTQTIVATMPVIMLPIAHYVRKERITWRAILGTITAVIGVMILCWK